MIDKKLWGSRFLLVSFFILLAAMIFIGLYPFNFFPPNRVQWVQNEPGLYFDGAGIAYTDREESISLKKAVSVELLLKERRGSKNWGPKEIFSFYDGAASPSLLVGQWGGRIFIYSRFEKNKGYEWYRLFRTNHPIPKGKSHLVTVTFDENEKAIYIDGQLSNRRHVEINSRTHIQFSGSFLLGNSPLADYGWRGEIRGLAVYNRILLPDEIVAHSREVSQKGMRGLVRAPGCLVLYPFDEREGNIVKSILSKPLNLSIPVSQNALGRIKLSLPYKDMRFFGFSKPDFIENIAFFIPFGILLSMIIFKKYTTSYWVIFLMVTLAGALLSCVIEGFQLYLPGRIPGMADIFGNILGSLFGMLITFIILKEES
jgi:VanZ like family/Concanavalin A-like lectin/glucanases superfamily